MLTLEEMREKAQKKAKEGKSRNPLDFIPPTGESRVRLLPPIDDNATCFYVTHQYHYLPLDKGMYIYTPREFVFGGKRHKDPIDVAVEKLFQQEKDTKQKAFGDIARTVKRKRHFFCHSIIVDENDVSKKYRVIVDRSNKGLLFRALCRTMGLPFFFDVADSWVDKTTLKYSDGREYFHLLDFDNGHDYQIVLKKGANKWDYDYTDSFPIRTARPLNDLERSLLEKRVDLDTYVTYEEGEEGYNNVKNLWDRFVEEFEGGETSLDEPEAGPDEANVASGKLPPKAETAKDASAPAPAALAPDANIDAVLDEIEKQQQS